MRIAAVIVAAGRGTRVGGGVPKQWRALAGMPVARHAMETFYAHPAVSDVRYPGRKDHPQFELARRQMQAGGTMIAFDLGDQAAAFRFMNALRIILISNNLGDAKSIITHPATTTHQRLTEDQRAELGIGPGLVRLSIGLEDPQDLIGDLMGALDAI